MAGLLKDTCQLAADILEGKYDGDLDHVIQAAQHRVKVVAHQSGIRKGAKVRLKHDARNKDFRGREGRVVRINKKSVSVDLECEQCGRSSDVPDSTPWGDRCTACNGIAAGLTVPMDLLEAVS